MSDQIYSKVTADMDPFKQILVHIPGFSGYIERQARRDSDKLLRDTVANRYEQVLGRVSEIQRDLISRSELTFVDDLEAAAVKLRTFVDRIWRASRGYAGLFDAIKINQDELARVYQYDATLLISADEADRAVDNVEMSVGSDGLPAAIKNLVKISQQAIDAFDLREHVMMGIAAEAGTTSA